MRALTVYELDMVCGGFELTDSIFEDLEPDVVVQGYRVRKGGSNWTIINCETRPEGCYNMRDTRQHNAFCGALAFGKNEVENDNIRVGATAGIAATASGLLCGNPTDLALPVFAACMGAVGVTGVTSFQLWLNSKKLDSYNEISYQFGCGI